MTMHRASFTSLLMALVTGLAIPVAAPVDAAPVPPPASAEHTVKVSDEITTEIERFGAARVIISLTTETPIQTQTQSWQDYVEQRTALAVHQDVIQQTLSTTDSEILRTLTTTGLLSARVDQNGLDALAGSPSVRSIEVDRAHPPALNSTIGIVQADTMHTNGDRGSGQAIAIIDTGVQYDHPMFSDSASGSRVIAGACYSSNDASRGETSLCAGGVESDTGPTAGNDCPITIHGCGHGTHVAGIAAGGDWTTGSSGDTAVDIVGVAPDADIIAINVFTSIDVTGLTDTDSVDYYPCDNAFSPNCYDPCSGSYPCVLAYNSDILAGLNYVETLEATPNLIDNSNLASVNMSIGGGTPTDEHCDNTAIARAVRRLKANDIATVIASGNDGSSIGVSNPGCISDAITVGATTDLDAVASYTNTVDGLVDLYAPGSSVLSAVPDGSSAIYNGTSMAAPHVAGAVALMTEKFPDNSVESTLAQLQLFGTGVSTRGVVELGYSIPRINIFDAAHSTDDYLVVTLEGTGAGTVVDADLGIDCGDACTTVLSAGPETSTLVATPDGLSTFVGWTGCDSTDGTTCNVTISSNTQVSAEFSGPINNDKADAIDISVEPESTYTSSGSTNFATLETAEAEPACADLFGASVWYRYDAPSDGQLVLDTIGSDYDTVLTVYSDTDGTLEEVGCNDDIELGVVRTSELTIDIEYGTRYLVQVGGFESDTGSLTFNVDVALEPLVTITVNRLGDGVGSISGNQPDGDCAAGNTCVISAVAGSATALIATAETGSAFVAWSEGCSPGGQSTVCNITSSVDTTVTVWFRSTAEANAPTNTVVLRLPEVPSAISADEVEAGEAIVFDAPAGTFDPYERVVISLHSNPVVVEDTVAEADGSLSATVTIPADTSGGNHQIVALGQVSGSGLRAAISIEVGEVFVALTPVRIMDTRSGDMVGELDGSGSVRELRVAGAGGVPTSGVSAVALNVTAVSTETNDFGGFVTVYPCGTRPDASNLNFTSGMTIPNSVIAPVSGSGKVCFYVYGKTHLLADVSGYFPK